MDSTAKLLKRIKADKERLGAYFCCGRVVGSPHSGECPDRRREEEEAAERAALNEGRCPWSGMKLNFQGEGVPGSLSCDVCDCFGFDPKLVIVTQLTNKDGMDRPIAQL